MAWNRKCNIEEANTAIENPLLPGLKDAFCNWLIKNKLFFFSLPTHKGPLLVSILSQSNPAHALPSQIFKVHLHIIHNLYPGLPTKTLHTGDMHHPSHSSWRHPHTNTCAGVQIKKLLVALFSPVSCSALPPGTTYNDFAEAAATWLATEVTNRAADVSYTHNLPCSRPVTKRKKLIYWYRALHLTLATVFAVVSRGMSNFVHGLWPTLRGEKGHIQIRSRPAGIVYDFAHGQSLTPREEKSSCACLKWSWLNLMRSPVLKHCTNMTIFYQAM